MNNAELLRAWEYEYEFGFKRVTRFYSVFFFFLFLLLHYPEIFSLLFLQFFLKLFVFF